MYNIMHSVRDILALCWSMEYLILSLKNDCNSFRSRSN